MKYQRIEDMRIDQDLTIKEISALLECNRDVYSRYEKGIRDIPCLLYTSDAADEL